MAWGDPGVTEQLLIQENDVQYPSASGGNTSISLQRAGLLRRLRMYMQAHYNVSAFTAAPSKSAFGPLGAFVNQIRIEANGQIPLVDLSGLGAQVYNEIQNRDGSALVDPAFTTALNVTKGADLGAYDAIGATGDFYAKFPFEFNFAIPVSIRGQMQEMGLWLLQNQAVDLGINVNFNPMYAAAATPNALWSGGTVTGTAQTATSKIQVERELYSVPTDPKNYPNLGWVHQVIEFNVPFTGNFARFAIPRAGLLLRAIVISLDGSNNLVEYSDVSNINWVYGSNENPIRRPGWAMAQEYLQDYSRQAPKGVIDLDFYKWGNEGLKLVKSTEDLANLRIETNYSTTASGTQRIILDRLLPVVNK